ncbi:unnamed protein product [Prunus armeniaca]|uniref:Uncharacterized protein n=1 Tax=Prunus armeniaca TaxID=36596 RepID=A0A6J5TE71_PRUAR|nr:unnamed protein product [Prunus armeniaca]
MASWLRGKVGRSVVLRFAIKASALSSSLWSFVSRRVLLAVRLPLHNHCGLREFDCLCVCLLGAR